MKFKIDGPGFRLCAGTSDRGFETRKHAAPLQSTIRWALAAATGELAAATGELAAATGELAAATGEFAVVTGEDVSGAITGANRNRRKPRVDAAPSVVRLEPEGGPNEFGARRPVRTPGVPPGAAGCGRLRPVVAGYSRRSAMQAETCSSCSA